MEKLFALVHPRQMGALAIGGLAGFVAWEVFANHVAPLLMGGPLQPTALIASLFKNLFGGHPGAAVNQTVHVATAIIGYPVLYLGLRLAGLNLGRLGGSLMLGVVTWFLAMGVFVSMAGLPFMLGFGKIAWVSLAGHLAYGFATVYTFETLERMRVFLPPYQRRQMDMV